MDTEVYLLCPVCKTITDGIGSGDFTDSVKCKNCSNDFVSKQSIKYKKYQINEEGLLTFNDKKLYIPIEIEIA